MKGLVICNKTAISKLNFKLISFNKTSVLASSFSLFLDLLYVEIFWFRFNSETHFVIF